MAWLKSSDTSYDHPVVVAPLAWAFEHLDGQDPYDLVSMLYGLVWRCATYCGGKGQDYVVPDQVIAQMAGPNWRIRAEQAARAGYWTRCEDQVSWLLLDDAEHLFHIRRKAEIEWERARKRDCNNPSLTIPVRLRDGDGCRYCGVVVSWPARNTGRGGTYDHRNPGRPAVSPDDLVVCCRSCNATRRENRDAEAWAMRPAPVDPYYGPESRLLLAKHGHHVTGPGEPASSGPTPSDPAPSGATPERSVTRAPAGDADVQTISGHPDSGLQRFGSGTGRRGRRGGRGHRPTAGGR